MQWTSCSQPTCEGRYGVCEGQCVRGSVCARVSMCEGQYVRGLVCARVSMCEGQFVRGSVCVRVSMIPVCVPSPTICVLSPRTLCITTALIPHPLASTGYSRGHRQVFELSSTQQLASDASRVRDAHFYTSLQGSQRVGVYTPVA